MRSDHESLLLFVASEDEFNNLCEGVAIGHHMPWPSRGITRIKSEQVGTLVRKQIDGSKARPIALVVRREDQRRLFGRFSSLRSDFSPLTSWCHLFEPEMFEMLDEAKRVPDFHGYGASWCGLAIAEASLLAERSVDVLRVASCYATASFAVGRATSLWPQISLSHVFDKYQECNKSIRGTSSVSQSVQKLIPIWQTLVEARYQSLNNERNTVRMVTALLNARLGHQPNEAEMLAREIKLPAEFGFLSQLDHIGPEERVGLFDQLILEALNSRGEQREVYVFLAGYIATIAAGGLPSLSLAEKVSGELPEVLAWAYVIGGIGEEVTWSSSFQGLGRLVSRELERPFHIDEAPQCDFGLDEASCLIDRQLNDPLVHLKIKQQRLVSVAILPGVNISVPLQEVHETRQRTVYRDFPQKPSKDNLRLFEQLWPLIEARLQDEGYVSGPEKSRSGRRKGQARLPLD